MGASETDAPIRAGDFYRESLTESEREVLPAARGMEGLGEEAAVLRVKLRTALAEEKMDLRLLKYGIDALVKVVATEYRLSPKSKRDLADSLAGTLEILGDLVLPPDR